MKGGESTMRSRLTPRGTHAAIAPCMKYLHGLSCALFVVACGTSDGADGEMDPETSDPQAAETGNATNPEDQPSSADISADTSIPAPSLTLGGSSTATVTTSRSGAGLVLDGGTESASYAIAFYSIAPGGMGATGEVTVNAAPGASFTYALRGTGGGYSSRYLRVQRVPGSDALQAWAASGPILCGQLVSGRPTLVTVSFDGVARTFDVLIAGEPTACTDLPAKTSGPITGFRVTDEGVAGYGGHVELTGFALIGSP
jgi:hypothetical protein